ncbi:MAG TPA: protein kinase [Candidatus Polarisedimenticolia bacterium]|nr:protein kinase [Candidatus Polarisedimenticolia bacterium]
MGELIGRRISHYLVEERLGAGGMGEVVRARDLALGRTVALKLLPQGFTPALKARLLAEAEHSSRLQHPGIATFYESGEAEGVAFIAMEYVCGRTLRDRLREGALPQRDAVAMAVSVLEAIGHAHAAGILHRDVKPENIMLVERGPAKLLDFGIAKHLVPIPDGNAGATRTVQTQAGEMWGTPGYMAPEQLLGREVDGRADLFAVGAVLFEAVSGREAFPGETSTARIARILSGEPPELDGTVTAALAQLLKRALARDAASRFPSAAAFLADLAAVDGARGQSTLPDTLAVFDLENLSGNADDHWIGSGVAESVASELMRVPGVSIVAREKIQKARAALTAAARSTEVLDLCQAVGCRWAISGGFQRMGDRVRVTSRLHEVSTGRVVAGEKIDGTLEGIFDIQDRLAQSVVKSLNHEIPQSRSTSVASDVKAYECYARGRRLWTRLEKGSFDQARALYEEAMRLDPRYAAPAAGLAAVHALRFTFTTDEAELDLGAGFARRAIELDPQLSDPHVWLAYALLRRNQVDEAYAEAIRAKELDSSSAYSTYFGASARLAAGRREEALALYQATVEVEPNHGFAWLGLGWTHLETGHGQDAVWCFSQASELERREREESGARTGPTAGASGYLGECLRRTGDLEAARERCLAGIDATERSDHMYRDSFRGVGLCALGRTALDQGDADAARAAFGQAIAHIRGRSRALGGGYLVVQALAGLARAGGGREHLDQALELFQTRRGFSFHWLWMCTDDVTLFELSRAARALGRNEEADTLLTRARGAGSVEAAASI